MGGSKSYELGTAHKLTVEERIKGGSVSPMNFKNLTKEELLKLRSKRTNYQRKEKTNEVL
jgi:hypothetical protein